MTTVEWGGTQVQGSSHFPRLFEPGRIGPMRLRNRTIAGPMVRNLANRDGSITRRYIDYAVERARGGAGLIMMESTFVDPVGRSHLFELGLHDDQVIPGLRRLVEEVHAHGARIAIQLNHAGREIDPRVTGMQPVGPSPVPCSIIPGTPLPRALEVEEIPLIVARYAAAARRARQAGFDTVEVHGAHGYLVDAFLSPHSNRRTDEYGGTLEKRMRFPLEVVRAVMEAVGPGFPVLCRISADEFLPEGLKLEESMAFSRELERTGVALVDVSAGVSETQYMTVPSMERQRCLHVPLASAIKRALSHTPVSVAGRINDPVDAERILEEGHSDFVTLARAFHADPYFAAKAAAGAVDDICRCLGCLACRDLMGKMQPVTCLANPAAAREREFALRPAGRRKRVLVVGGGPAGMEAARVAALRGHQVTLCERKGQLGGQLLYAQRPPCREDFGQLRVWLSHQIQRAGVEVRLGTDVTPDLVRQLRPDAIVVAAGASPTRPWIPGGNGHHVMTLLDALEPIDARGTHIVIVFGRHHACLAAEHLANQGARVTIVEPSAEMCGDVGFRISWELLRRLRAHDRVTILLETTVEEIGDGELRLRSRGEHRTLQEVDAVVWGDRFAPETRLADELLRSDAAAEIYTIGDCKAARTAFEAMHEGAEIGRRI